MDAVELAEQLVGLHSSDPATIYLSCWARLTGFRVEDLETALYDDRTLARVLCMRKTLFVQSREVVPIVHGACTRVLGPRERRRVVGLIADQGLAGDVDADRWVRDVEEATLAALHERGPAVATELSQDVPELKLKVSYGVGKTWGGEFGLSTRILFLLACDGRIVRARPRGTWLSTQYRWAPVDEWLGLDIEELPTEQAQADLLRRYLAGYGPVTFDDIRWWTGWTVRDTRRALATVAPIEVIGGDDVTRLALTAEARAPVGTDAPAGVMLLPSLDPLVMGYRDRERYLDPSLAAALFDRNGNAGPTIWVDGRVVGGWAQHPDGEVVTRVLVNDLHPDVCNEIDARAAALTDWLGDVRVIPRFRTPTDRALAS